MISPFGWTIYAPSSRAKWRLELFLVNDCELAGSPRVLTVVHADIQHPVRSRPQMDSREEQPAVSAYEDAIPRGGDGGDFSRPALTAAGGSPGHGCLHRAGRARPRPRAHARRAESDGFERRG